MQAGSSLFLFGWMVEVDCFLPKKRSGFYELLRDFCTFAKRYRLYIPKILALRGVHLHAVFNIIRLPKSLVVALEKSTFVYASSLRFARNACKGIDMIPAVF